MAQSTSIQRVQRLIDSVPLTNLLFTLLSTSYKKVQTEVYLKPLLLFLRHMLLFKFLIKLKQVFLLGHARKRLNVPLLAFNSSSSLIKYDCHHQAYILQRQRKGSVSSDASASTDSNTYYEDDFSSTEEDSSQGTVIALF